VSKFHEAMCSFKFISAGHIIAVTGTERNITMFNPFFLLEAVSYQTVSTLFGTIASQLGVDLNALAPTSPQMGRSNKPAIKRRVSALRY
jgi:hypothetical protein